MAKITPLVVRPAVALPSRAVGWSRVRRRVGTLLRQALLATVAIVFMVPFYWMASGALKSNEIRGAKVTSIKSQIAAGTYETDAKMDAAIDRLLDDLSR